MTDSRKTVVLVGAGGQLGRLVAARAPAEVTLHALGSRDLDVTDKAGVKACFDRLQPDLIINASAYTQVDRAEQDWQRAFAVNADGPAHIAAGAPLKARIIHISTDFVFDGSKREPYTIKDKTAPLGVYGRSKLAGEEQLLARCADDAVVIRTAWLYAAWGQNFMNTMLRLMAERDELAIVADQVGTPTAANTLAEVIWRFAERPDLSGIFHWTDMGQASWHEFASTIQRQALAIGLLKREIPIFPITTADYPTAAQRPAYSVLDNSGTLRSLGIKGLAWQDTLRHVLQERLQLNQAPA